MTVKFVLDTINERIVNTDSKEVKEELQILKNIIKTKRSKKETSTYKTYE